MRRKVLVCVMCMISVCFLCGCTGIDPEKRNYPQVMAVDLREGEFCVQLAMPNMKQETGQEKSGGDQSMNLMLRGKGEEEISWNYQQTQEKYLDLGHLEVLILGESLKQGQLWEQVFAGLKGQTVIGEDIYLFSAVDVDAVIGYNGTQTDALGNYLTGIYENRPSSVGKKGVTLREAYQVWYETGDLIQIPSLVVDEMGNMWIK